MKQGTAGTHQIIIVQCMYQAQFPALHLSPSGQRKTTDIVGVYDVRRLSVKKLADPPSRLRIPHLSDVPSEAVKAVRLFLTTKGPVEIVEWQPIDAHAIPILDN